MCEDKIALFTITSAVPSGELFERVSKNFNLEIEQYDLL